MLGLRLEYQLCNRPCSQWSPCGSMVEYCSAESKVLKFWFMVGIQIFFLSHVHDETKNLFLYVTAPFKMAIISVYWCKWTNPVPWQVVSSKQHVTWQALKLMYKTAKKFAIHSQSNKHSESESSFRLTLSHVTKTEFLPTVSSWQVMR